MTDLEKAGLRISKSIREVIMKTLFALVLIAPLFSFAKNTETTSAAAETKVPVKEGYETLDMNQFKDLNRPSKSGGGVSFTSNCTSKSGVQHKETDAGYAACLREAQLDNSMGTKNGATPNVGIKLGD